jgi:hypothetical protein
MHFQTIYFEFGRAHVIDLSSGEISKVCEQPRVIVSDQDKLPFTTFDIESGEFAGSEFSWMPM